MIRKLFRATGEIRFKGTLQSVRSDVTMWPDRGRIVQQKKYFVRFIDDYSR